MSNLRQYLIDILSSDAWYGFWTSACSIATFAAVCVALWQTKYSQRKRIRMEFSDQLTILIPHIGGTTANKNFMAIKATNVGNRKVSIEYFGIAFNDGTFSYITKDDVPVEVKNLPVQLDLDEQYLFYLSKEHFVEGLIALQSKLPRDKPIRFYAQDSAGKKYFCKSQKTVQEYIDSTKQK